MTKQYLSTIKRHVFSSQFSALTQKITSFSFFSKFFVWSAWFLSMPSTGWTNELESKTDLAAVTRHVILGRDTSNYYVNIWRLWYHPVKPNLLHRVVTFPLLTPSPWPIFSSFAVAVLVIGFAAYLNYYPAALNLFFSGLALVICAFFFWCRDLIRELLFYNKTSVLVEDNIKLAFWLFICSEALLFVSFFWAFFHSAWEPGIQLGTIWPPYESIQMNSLLLPSWNTAFLLLSGAALTWGQYAIIAGIFWEVILAFSVLLFYSVYFMLSQWHEYTVAFHQVNDGVFGSSMYVLTLFHGGHVLIGTLFLVICLIRFVLGHFRPTSYLGLTLAAWYWHFVDVVWVLVYLWIYLWGSNIAPNEHQSMFWKNFFNIVT